MQKSLIFFNSLITGALGGAYIRSPRWTAIGALKFIFIASLALTNLTESRAQAGEIGLLPPDLDYGKLCAKAPAPKILDFNWDTKTPATSGLPEQKLMDLANYYYFKGNPSGGPDYRRAKDIVEYLAARGTRLKQSALMLKSEMLLRGKGYAQNTQMAHRALASPLRAGLPRAYNTAADIYAAEGDYAKAADFYKKAYIRGDKISIVALAYLYHDKKVPATEQELESVIVDAQDYIMESLMKGDCHALTVFGVLYDRLNNLPRAEYYSALWFEKAALLDEIEPKLYLAEIIQRRYTLPYDKPRVIALWKEAAELGSGRAMFLLGESALLSQKDNADLKAAIGWLEKAAERGDVKAMEMLAVRYDKKYPAFKDEAKRLKWLEKAAEFPEVKDKTLMSLVNLYQRRGDIPSRKIFTLLQRAADKGNYEAYMKLGDAYRYGAGVDISPARALRYYRLAASNGQTGAMKALKETYECGIGAPANPKLAKLWTDQIEYYDATSTIDSAYRFLLKPVADVETRKKIETDLTLLALARKNSEAMVLLALYHEKTGDLEKSGKWLKKALQKDQKDNKNYPAHALLGRLYYEGKYVEKNMSLAVKFLTTSDQEENANSSQILGKMNLEKSDYPEAEKYFFRSIGNGKYTAYMDLVEVARRKKDDEALRYYLQIAALNNDAQSAYELAELYAHKASLTASDQKKRYFSLNAQYWFNHGMQRAPCAVKDIIAVANVYMEGKYGIPKDKSKAQKWISRAAGINPDNEKEKALIAKAILISGGGKDDEKKNGILSFMESKATTGDKDAASFLSKLYLDKSFSGYNPEKGLEWITTNAKKGDVSSMLDLANMYASGYGVPPSVEKASGWLKKAADAGSQEAILRLNSMNTRAQH